MNNTRIKIIVFWIKHWPDVFKLIALILIFAMCLWPGLFEKLIEIMQTKND